MVRHIIIWKLKSALTDAERTEVKARIKAGLEGLSGRIPGLLSIAVHTEGLSTSNGDLMLESAFTDAAALQGYAIHPEHVAVATGVVRPHTELRMCYDFEEK